MFVCSEVSEVTTEKALNASQIYFGFSFLKVLQRIVELKNYRFTFLSRFPLS